MAYAAQLEALTGELVESITGLTPHVSFVTAPPHPELIVSIEQLEIVLEVPQCHHPRPQVA